MKVATGTRVVLGVLTFVPSAGSILLAVDTTAYVRLFVHLRDLNWSHRHEKRCWRPLSVAVTVTE